MFFSFLSLSLGEVEGGPSSTPFPGERGGVGHGNLVHDQPELPCLGDELLVGEAFGVLGLLVALPVSLDDVLQSRIVG